MKALITTLALIMGAQAAQAAVYDLDVTHTEVGFSIKHLMISTTKGRFNKFSGGFEFDEAKKELKNIKVEIQVDSIDTNVPDRDKHLRSADFFNVAVEKNKTMTFVGDKVEFKDNKPVKITGQLTMNGQTKPVTLAIDYRGSAKDPWGNQRVGFALDGKINRKDWGLTWNKALETGGVVVGEEVTIHIDGEGILKAAAKK